MKMEIIIDDMEQVQEIKDILKADHIDEESYRTEAGNEIHFDTICGCCGGLMCIGTITEEETQALKDKGYNDACFDEELAWDNMTDDERSEMISNMIYCLYTSDNLDNMEGYTVRDESAAHIAHEIYEKYQWYFDNANEQLANKTDEMAIDLLMKFKLADVPEEEEHEDNSTS